MDKPLTLIIDAPQPGLMTFVLRDGSGVVIDRVECEFSGPVDNLVLTTIDSLFKRSNLDRFALKSVELGTGIDKGSSLYRIVQSVSAAVAAAR